MVNNAYPPGAANKYTKLTKSMFESPQKPEKTFPILSGKAAAVKQIGPPLLDVWVSKMDSTNTTHMQIKLAMQFSIKLDQIIDAYPSDDALPDSAAKELETTFWAYSSVLNAVRLAYGDRKLFNVVFKNHWLAHIVINARHTNPRKAWNYCCETYMRFIRNTVAASADARVSPAVVRKAMEKYNWAVTIDLMPSDMRLFP